MGVFTLFAVSCKKPSTAEDQPSFNKKEMLTNVADQIILPFINEFSNCVGELKSKFTSFETSASESDFSALQIASFNAYLAWQKLNPFDFGPMQSNGLKGSLNTYPTDTSKVIDNVNSGNSNLSSFGNIDAVGFSSLDFLLNRVNAFDFMREPNYLAYTKKVIEKIVNESGILKSGWASYRATFISQDGTESTSSFSQLVNEFNRDFEICKNAKVGIPLGKKSLGFALPEYFEARFSGTSKRLFEQNVTVLRTIFEGNTGKGFDDYLIHLDKAALSTQILNQFDAILSKSQSINGTFGQAITAESQKMEDLYLLLSQQVVNIKTDMTSAFGVLITYQDNDGD